MSVLSSVLERLRSKRVEQSKSLWQTYHEFVVALANDSQVDVDQLASVMDALDKSDADLEADIENQRERSTFAAQHSECLRLRGEVPKLEAVHEKAKSDYNDAVNKLHPKVMAAFDAWNQANNKILTLASAESRLLESCQDPQLLDQQKEIHAKRTELLAELRAMDDRNPHNEPRKTELKNQLSDLERQAAEVRTKMLQP